jgi:hypothetical protein
MSSRFFAVDTLQLSKRLQKAGLEQKVSEELAEVIKETHIQSLEGLATKQDIDLVRKDLKILENEIYVRLGRIIYISTAFLASIIGLAVAIIKL